MFSAVALSLRCAVGRLIAQWFMGTSGSPFILYTGESSQKMSRNSIFATRLTAHHRARASSVNMFGSIPKVSGLISSHPGAFRDLKCWTACTNVSWKIARTVKTRVWTGGVVAGLGCKVWMKSAYWSESTWLFPMYWSQVSTIELSKKARCTQAGASAISSALFSWRSHLFPRSSLVICRSSWFEVWMSSKLYDLNNHVRRAAFSEREKSFPAEIGPRREALGLSIGRAWPMRAGGSWCLMMSRYGTC